MSINEEDVVIIGWDEEIYKRANDRAKKKAEWMNTWKYRTEEQRRLDFLDGQLGEEGLKKFLDEGGVKYSYYDDIRTDDFKEKDKFDFIVKKINGKEMEISVKSSKLKKSIFNTIQENNILAYPGQIKEITVQPFIDYLNKRIVLMGWASKEQLESVSPEALHGAFSDKPVLYHKIVIKNCNPMDKLIDFIKE